MGSIVLREKAIQTVPMSVLQGHPDHASHTPHYSKLIHQNAVLGCSSWAAWQELTFESSPRFTWYHSPIPDILFNSVLDADLTPETLKSSLEIISGHHQKAHTPIAWMIPFPAHLTEEHRALFREFNFSEHQGTTGMFLQLSQDSTKDLISHPNRDNEHDGAPRLLIQTITSDAELRGWANVLINSYGFPEQLAEPWFALHKAIGFRKEPPTSPHLENEREPAWQHFTLLENGETIATCSLFFGPNIHSSSLANLAVTPKARGHGRGTYLARQCLQILTHCGYETVTLYASEDAYSMYTRLGFQGLTKNLFFVRTC